MQDAGAGQAIDWLVIGASGAVGRFLLRGLNTRGDTVVALSRRPAPAWARAWPRIGWRPGALPQVRLAELPPAPRLVSAGPLDAFADACAVGLPPGVRRVVALSSLSIDWKADSPDPRERALAQRLLRSEQILRAACDANGVGYVILRPGLIWGAGIDASLTPLLRRARRWRLLPWPRFARGLRCPVHAGDVAAALLAATELPDPPAEAWALPGPEALRFDDLVDRLLECAATDARRLPLPLPLAVPRALARLGSGSAAVLVRSAQDQLADARAWSRLALRPRGFDPQPADFIPWPE